MKTSLRYYKSLALTSLLTFAAASLVTASAAESNKGGKDILHLNLTKNFTNDSVASGANGSVRLKYHEQGRSTVQSLDLSVSSLDGNTPYALLASVGGSGLTEVDQFTTDADGNAKIRYTLVENANGKVHKPGNGKLLLPEALSPLSEVRQLAIAKVVESVVQEPEIWVDLETPEHLSYLVKRDISTNTIPASLRIQANDQQGQFRLTAENLIDPAGYTLWLNEVLMPAEGGEPVFTSDEKGRLTIRLAILNPLDALALKLVQVKDPNGDVVLEVSLP